MNCLRLQTETHCTYTTLFRSERGTILDGDDEVLVANRPVYRIGIDKTFIDSDQWEDDAIALAEELGFDDPQARSEEHTSELQSRGHLVCRLLLEKNK